MTAPQFSEKDSKAIAAVRRINDTWIVRGRLRESTNSFLQHLEETDPHRLIRSCVLALEMVHHREPGQDPKPVFYAGIFGLATPAEARRYLSGHCLTHSVWAKLHGQPDPSAGLAAETRTLSVAVAEKLDAVRRRLLPEATGHFSL